MAEGATDACPHVCYRRRVYWAVGWLALIALAALVDTRVVGLAGDFSANVMAVKNSVVATVLKLPGDFRFTLAVSVVAVLLHPWRWRAAGLICLSVMVGGLAYTVLKWCFGRHRPNMHMPFEFSPFIGGWHGLIVSEPNLSFPSGHATCAFATAAALAVLYPRWRWAFYAAAALTGLERVAERAHYLSDVVAAAGIGVLSVQIAIYLANLVINRDHPPKSEGFPVVIQGGLGQAEPAPKSAEPQ